MYDNTENTPSSTPSINMSQIMQYLEDTFIKGVQDTEILLIKTLVDFRKSKNLTQEKLAEQCGLSATAISDIEKRKSSPKLNNLIKICDVLGLKLTLISME